MSFTLISALVKSYIEADDAVYAPLSPYEQAELRERCFPSQLHVVEKAPPNQLRLALVFIAMLEEVLRGREHSSNPIFITPGSSMDSSASIVVCYEGNVEWAEALQLGDGRIAHWHALHVASMKALGCWMEMCSNVSTAIFESE